MDKLERRKKVLEGMHLEYILSIIGSIRELSLKHQTHSLEQLYT